MTEKPALHRSLIFWAGILVMVFIGWAWWVSLQSRAYLVWDRWRVSNYASGLIVESRYAVMRDNNWPVGGLNGGYREMKALPFPMKLLPSARWLRGKNESLGRYHVSVMGAGWIPGWRLDSVPQGLDEYFEELTQTDSAEDWMLFVPHWVLMGLTAGLWVILLAWRRRRMKRKMVMAAE